MADQPFNIALGRTVELYNRVKSNDPTNAAFIIVLLTVNEADDTLNNYDDLGALIAGANTEATHTNYARKTIDDTALAALPAPDDTNNRIDIDLPDQTWTAMGAGAALTKALVCYDSDTTTGTDANIIPVAHFDFVATPDGNDLTIQFDAAGFYRASLV